MSAILFRTTPLRLSITLLIYIQESGYFGVELKNLACYRPENMLYLEVKRGGVFNEDIITSKEYWMCVGIH